MPASSRRSVGHRCGVHAKSDGLDAFAILADEGYRVFRVPDVHGV